MNKFYKQLIVISGIIIVTAIICKMLGVFNVVLGSAMGQLPVIGWILTVIDYLNLLKTVKMLKNSATVVQGIKAFIPLFASLCASLYVFESRSDKLEFPYNFIMGFLICCVTNGAIRWILFDLFNFIQTEFSNLEAEFSKLMF